MKIRNVQITNDFEVPLFVFYADKNRHFMILSPEQSLPLTMIVKSRLVEMELLKFWFYDPVSHEGQYVRFEDISITFEPNPDDLKEA